MRSQRGADGGYWLGRPAADITVADVIRAVEGPLASVRGGPPEEVDYQGGWATAEVGGGGEDVLRDVSRRMDKILGLR